MTETPSIPTYSIETLKASHGEPRDFDFLRFEFFAQDIDHLKVAHRHQFYTFLLVTEGEGSHEIDFNSYTLRPGRLFLISPGQVHAWNSLVRVKGFVIFFTDSFVALSKGRKLIAQWPLFKAGQLCYVDLLPEETNEWVREFLFMEVESQKPDEFSQDAIFFSVGSLLIRASRLYARQRTASQTGQDILFQFQELIEQHFLEHKIPKAYAMMMNITANHLNAICRKKSGKSAGELIRQRVLLEAKRLLAHTEYTVAEIAYQLGFADNSYFGRFFKRYAGLTPESFRRLQR